MNSGPENPSVQKLVVALKKQAKKTGKPVWARIAELLERPSRRKTGVNVVDVAHSVKEGEIAVVPAKVLSLGKVAKKMTVIAFAYSPAAIAKIEKAGGKAMRFDALLSADGSKMRIII